MDEMVDSFESPSKNTGIKHENVWSNCAISPLNSLSMASKLNSNNIPEEETSSCENASTEMMQQQDVLLVDIEIGTKRLENIPIKCECPLEDLAKEFAENETVKVVYFLNEKITKGGDDCDVAEAQVLVKLKPNWKWLSVETLVDDPSVTVQEVFADIQNHFKLVFGLAPKIQRDSLAQTSNMLSPSTSHSEDQLTAMVTQLKEVLANYPISDVFSKDSLPEKDSTSENNCHGLSQAKTKELKSVLTKLNTVLNSKHQEISLPKCASIQGQTSLPEQQNEDPVASQNPAQNQDPVASQNPVQTQTPNTSSDTSLLNHCTKGEDISMATTSDQSAAPLSRLRTQFDPNFEVPRLKDWFEENPMPSRSMISDYVNQLNADDIRQGKQPVTDRAVYIWFKNTRARKYKRKSWTQS